MLTGYYGKILPPGGGITKNKTKWQEEKNTRRNITAATA
jgi:hypothetical protein